jgi:Ca2+-binding EF-hand superfamily protein
MKRLGVELNADALNEMFLKADADGSGTIDFQEFKTFMSDTKTMFQSQMETYIFF